MTKNRYSYELLEPTPETPHYRQPVVLDHKRSKRDQVIAFCTSRFMAKRVASAMNMHQQRKLNFRNKGVLK